MCELLRSIGLDSVKLDVGAESGDLVAEVAKFANPVLGLLFQKL